MQCQVAKLLLNLFGSAFFWPCNSWLLYLLLAPVEQHLELLLCLIPWPETPLSCWLHWDGVWLWPIMSLDCLHEYGINSSNILEWHSTFSQLLCIWAVGTNTEHSLLHTSWNKWQTHSTLPFWWRKPGILTISDSCCSGPWHWEKLVMLRVLV